MSKIAILEFNNCFECPFEYGGTMMLARCGHDGKTLNCLTLVEGILTDCPLPDKNNVITSEIDIK